MKSNECMRMKTRNPCHIVMVPNYGTRWRVWHCMTCVVCTLSMNSLALQTSEWNVSTCLLYCDCFYPCTLSLRTSVKVIRQSTNFPRHLMSWIILSPGCCVACTWLSSWEKWCEYNIPYLYVMHGEPSIKGRQIVVELQSNSNDSTWKMSPISTIVLLLWFFAAFNGKG